MADPPPAAASSYDEDDLIVPSHGESPDVVGSGFGPAPPALTPSGRIPRPAIVDPPRHAGAPQDAKPEEKEPKQEIEPRKEKKRDPLTESQDPFEDDPFAAADAPPRVETPSGLAADPFADEKQEPAPRAEKAARKARARPKVILPPPATVIPSTGATDTSNEEPPLPTRKPLAGFAAVCLLLVVCVAGVGVWWIESDDHKAERATFLASVDPTRPEDGLLAAESLSQTVRDDPEVKALVDRLRDTQNNQGARKAAEVILDALDAEKRPSRRIEICARALAVDPGCARAYLERARTRIASTRGDTRDPLADLYSALTIDPNYTEAYVERAAMQLALGRRQAAQTDLEKAAELAGSAPLGVLASAHLRLLDHEPALAKPLYERALRGEGQEPVHSAARRGLARALLDLAEYRAAWELALEAQLEDPGEPESHLLVAEAREQLNPDAKASLKDLAHALRLDPDHPRALALQAWLQLDTGAPKSARTSAERSVRRDPTQALAQLTLARLARAAERPGVALRHLAKATESARGREKVTALILRARVRIDQSGGIGAAVREDLERALALDPIHPHALALRAEARAADGDDAGALNDLNVALNARPALPDSYFLRATLNLRSSPAPLRRVIDDLSQALALSPAMTKAYLPRATAYQLASHFDEALADIARADGHASPGALALIRGHCHYGRGEWSEAKTAYREHLRVDPSSDHRDLVLANLRQCDARLESATSDF